MISVRSLREAFSHFGPRNRLVLLPSMYRPYRGRLVPGGAVGAVCLSWLLLAAALSLLVPARVLAEARSEELESSGAVLAGWTVTTGLMVGLAAIPIARCDQDLACLGTAILSVGTFVLAHPFVAAAGVHWLTDVAGDRQPYWHSLVSQLAGDALAITAFALAVKLAPQRPPAQKQLRMRALVFTTCALLSLAGPLLLRPVLDGDADSPSMSRMALSF